MYQDLNSNFLIWIRVILFLNQLLWTIVSWFGTEEMFIILVNCLALIPSLLFILLENIVLLVQPYDSSIGLHKIGWTVYRIGSALIGIALIIGYFTSNVIMLIVIAWFIIIGVLVAEITISCQYYDNCCHNGYERI